MKGQHEMLLAVVVEEYVAQVVGVEPHFVAKPQVVVGLLLHSAEVRRVQPDFVAFVVFDTEPVLEAVGLTAAIAEAEPIVGYADDVLLAVENLISQPVVGWYVSMSLKEIF